ncbi:hypothetical protein BKA66DRAFT_528761 [Pyrenochaeta sp. MPI-SDFR-AT-0127]|nr:hypothetical protein BKA66DRAFT_528761 [Pyrenochaeta sp. MPI-SDFR-AT-0127]
MPYLLRTLLFVATASAQFTTSFWALKVGLGTDKVGYYGSVVDANSTHTTIALLFDNGTDVSALERDNDTPWTNVIGPTVYGNRDKFNPAPTPGANRMGSGIFCERKLPLDATAEGVCTVSYGPELAYGIQCDSNTPRSSSTRYISKTFTYSGRGTYSAGVETIVETLFYGVADTTSRPSWCTINSEDASEALVTTFAAEPELFATYQVVITAGLEKLDATQGAGASAPTGSVTSSRGTGAAAPLKTMGPAVVGLGVAAAAFIV